MKKDLYNDIKSALIQAGIADVMLYRIPNRDVIAKSPFAMIEFPDVPYVDCTGKRQESTPTFVVHLMYDSVSSEDDDVILDMTQDVYVTLFRLGCSRVREKTAIFDEETMDFQIHFEAPKVTDEDAITRYITVPRPPVDIKTEEE